MSSDEGLDDDSVAARHRREKKVFREKCTAMKKAAKCGNKQKQKEAASEIERLERELDERHKNELRELGNGHVTECSKAEPENCDNVDGPEESDDGEKSDPATPFYKQLNVNRKAKKKQEKKKKVEQRLKEAADSDRTNNASTVRLNELDTINKIVADKKLEMFEISADGDCMYNAIAHQMTRSGVTSNGKLLRKKCAEYMRAHKDDFLPFLSDDDGEPLDDEGFEKYLLGVERTAEKGGVWGGELELNALSRHLKKVIEVLKTDGLRRYGEEFASSDPELAIVYLRKAYRLGEHYNSTVTRTF